jgi:hypothetical protein
MDPIEEEIKFSRNRRANVRHVIAAHMEKERELDAEAKKISQMGSKEDKVKSKAGDIFKHMKSKA